MLHLSWELQRHCSGCAYWIKFLLTTCPVLLTTSSPGFQLQRRDCCYLLYSQCLGEAHKNPCPNSFLICYLSHYIFRESLSDPRSNITALPLSKAPPDMAASPLVSSSQLLWGLRWVSLYQAWLQNVGYLSSSDKEKNKAWEGMWLLPDHDKLRKMLAQEKQRINKLQTVQDRDSEIVLVIRAREALEQLPRRKRGVKCPYEF